MNIIEQIIVPKSPNRKSEDGIVITNNFIAVIDGSTSKSARQVSRFSTNGQYAMELVSKCISKMPANTTCHQFCVLVSRSLARATSGGSFLTGRWFREPKQVPDPVDRLAASAVIFSRLRREIWMVGDCQCMVNGQLFENPKPYEAELAAKRADIISNSPDKSQFLINDTAREAIIPMMKQIMRQQQNVKYAVIDGTRIPEEHVPVLTLDFHPQEIVLASDGYPFLCPTLKESEAALARQLANDPLNIGTFQATKGCMKGNRSFDDRAYIRFNV
ncbi:MAG: hypothetical protein IJ533_03945 [Prevotella sp.]|nr:hypothetical protein [Prevotella sp.]